MKQTFYFTLLCSCFCYRRIFLVYLQNSMHEIIRALKNILSRVGSGSGDDMIVDFPVNVGVVLFDFDADIF